MSVRLEQVGDQLRAGSVALRPWTGIGVTWAAYDAVQQALSHHRLDGRRVSLPKVLLQVLEQPDLVEEYLDGKELSE